MVEQLGTHSVQEGSDANFAPIWHGFFRGRRREGAMLRSGLAFLQGREGKVTFVVHQGLLMGTSEAPRLSSLSFDRTFARWMKSAQRRPCFSKRPLPECRRLQLTGHGAASKTTSPEATRRK